MPTQPGVASPIQHVIYIVKENRTYDQVFGDLGHRQRRCVAGGVREQVTPNHRKLAREFVLLDNFYVNSDVSADGHNWSTAAIAPDYTQKMWPNSYAGRRKLYDYEGGEPANSPPAGYLWTKRLQAGICMRNYGFRRYRRSRMPAGRRAADGNREGLDARPCYEPAVSGVRPGLSRYGPRESFLEDLAEFEKSGEMPRLMFCGSATITRRALPPARSLRFRRWPITIRRSA